KEPEDQPERIPDLPLIARDMYPSLPSSPSSDSNVRGIFKAILQNPNPLILQPTTWLLKDTFESLNNLAILVPSISLPLTIAKAKTLQSMKIPHTLPDL